MNLRLPSPLNYFSRENEAETRRIIEQAFAQFGAQGSSFFDELVVGSTASIAGATTIASLLTLGNDLVFTQDIGLIKKDDDNQRLALSGGSALDQDNGGLIQLLGNGFSAGRRGQVLLQAGQPGTPAGDDGTIVFETGGVENVKITEAGALVVGDDPGGPGLIRTNSRVIAETSVRAGEPSRPAEMTMYRTTAVTSGWTTLLPGGASCVTGLAQVRDATNGGSALVYFDVNFGVTIITSAAAATTIVASATPGATELGVRISGTDFQVLAGSSRNNVQVDTVILFSVL